MRAPCASLAFLRAPLVLVAILSAAPARASGGEETTGAVASANGLAARVFARGAEAAYYNPALLPEATTGTAVGFFMLVAHESIELDARPPGSDVPAAIYHARLANADGSTSRLALRPLPTAEIPSPRADTNETYSVPYLTIGFVKPLAKESLVLGFYGVLPLSAFQRQAVFFADEREQYFSNALRFELLGDRLSQPSFAVALGSQPARWISIGAGLDITFGTEALTSVHVPDAADQRVVLLNPDIHVTLKASPHFAIVTHPTRALRLMTTLHMPISSDTDGENRVRFWNFTYPDGGTFVRQSYTTSIGYEPMRFGAGARFTVSEPTPSSAGVEIGAQALISEYRTYVDRHGERPPDSFHDTVSIAAGVAIEKADSRFTADATFVPSPVPAQDGRTSYVDGARFGGDLALEIPLSAFGVHLRANGRLFGQLILPRRETKSPNAKHPVIDELPDGATDVTTNMPIDGAAGLQTNNPGYPGYESSGFLFGAGFTLTAL